MEYLGSYLLQMACWLAGFWLVYALVLRKETFFALNRWFLLFGLILSIVLPFFPLKYRVVLAVPQVPLSLTIGQSAAEITNHGESVTDWMLVVYLLGVLFCMARFLLQNRKLSKLRNVSEKVAMGSVQMVRLETESAPFSYFNTIYVSKKMCGEVELKAVVAHEKVHIEERHWVDLLLLEVARALQWFNPLLIYYSKAMMQNHEYLADLGTLKNGVSARTYKAVLANQMLGVPVVSFANCFTLFNPTKRILMMNKNKTKPVKRLKLLWVLPIFALILSAFARPVYVSDAGTYAVSAEETMKIKGKILDENGDALPGASVIISNSTIGTLSDAKGNFILDGVNSADNIVVSFVGYETVVSPATKDMTFKMERNVVSIEVNKTEMAPPPPPPPPPFPLFDLKSSEGGKSPLFVIDGKISNIDINTIDPETIESISVLKDVSATQKYGEKAKDGVILITTKKEASKDDKDEVFVVVEAMPQYPGGEDALKQYVRERAAKSGLSGKAYVTFIVDTKGDVKDARVIRSTSDQLKQPALEIVNAMPKWKPGSQRSKPVKVSYTIVIEF